MPTAPTAREDKLIFQTAFVSTYPPRRCGIATVAATARTIRPALQLPALQLAAARG